MKKNEMTNVTRRAGWLTAILVSAAFAGGCTESSRPEATGKGSVRGIHAIVDAPEVAFLIEERTISGLRYKQGSTFNDYDDLEYTFNFDSLPFADQPSRRLASQFIDFQADTEYTLVLTGSLANPAIVSWEAPEREWDGTETVFEADFVHLSPQLGQVDVYFAETGTVPVDGNQIATMQHGDRIAYREFPVASYEVIVTPPNQPDTILFQSLSIPASAAIRATLALYDVDPSITALVAVALINNAGSATTLADVNSPSQLRLFHTRQSGASVDAYFDADFDNVIFADLGFGELSPYADVSAANTQITLTDVGDSTSTVFESEVGVPPNSRNTVLFGGPDDTLTFKSLRDEARPLSTYPLARITNMVTSVASIDLYVLDPGTPIDDEVAAAVFGIVGAADTGFLPIETGMREITATRNGEKSAISAPVVVDLQAGDILDMVLLDTADPAVVELRTFDSNQP